MTSVILDAKATGFWHRWLTANVRRKDVCVQQKSQRTSAFLIFDSRMFAEQCRSGRIPIPQRIEMRGKHVNFTCIYFSGRSCHGGGL